VSVKAKEWWLEFLDGDTWSPSVWNICIDGDWFRKGQFTIEEAMAKAVEMSRTTAVKYRIVNTRTGDILPAVIL
jgi:hypothetical protein